MLAMTAEARGLLAVASDVARFRGAEELELFDVVMATVLGAVMSPGANLYPDGEESPSTSMLPFSSELSSAFPRAEELSVEDLRRTCTSEFARVRRMLRQ